MHVKLLAFFLSFWPLLAPDATLAQASPSGLPELVVQTGHSSPVNAIAFSPDGNWLASASSDKTLRLWDVASGREVQAFVGHRDEVKSVVFSPDGRLLASAGEDMKVRVWDVATGREIRSLSGHTDSPTVLSFSPDGRSLASDAYLEKVVTISDVATGQTVRAFELSDHHHAQLSPDWRWLAATQGVSIIIWDFAAGAAVKQLAGNDQVITTLAFSADGRRLASGSVDKVVKVWDVTTGNQVFSQRVSQSNVIGPMGDVALSGDGRWLATPGLSEDGNTVMIWDVPSGRLLRSLAGHKQQISATAFSPDGHLLASASADTTVKLWDTATGNQVHTTTGLGSINAVAFSPDGRWFASGSSSDPLSADASSLPKRSLDKRQSEPFSSGSALSLWEVSAGRRVRAHSVPGVSITDLKFSPNGPRVTAAYDETRQRESGRLASTNFIRTFDTATGREVRSMKVDDYRFAYSADGRWLAIGAGKTVKLVETATGRETRAFHIDLPDGYPGDLALSPDGQWLASAVTWSPHRKQLTAPLGYAILVWDVASQRLAATLQGHNNGIPGIAFNPGGKLLASIGLDDTVRLWEIPSGNQLQTFGIPTQGNYFASLAFSPNGRWLAAGAANNTVHLWDLSSGYKSASLSGHTANVTAVAFSPDSRWLLSGSGDGSTRLWDTQTDTERLALFSLPNGKDWLAVAPDGLFDGTADAMQQVAWRGGPGNDAVTPLASFFTDFYRPGLLADALTDNPPRAQVDIATTLQIPGLRNMLAQKQARIEVRAGRPIVCFEQLPVIAVQAPIDAGPDLPAEINGFRVAPADTSCKYQKELPAGADATSLQNWKPDTFTTPWDGQPSATSHSTLHVLTIGVGQYKAASGYDELPYALTSAKAIEDFFKVQSSAAKTPYAQVRVWPGLFNGAATRDAIRNRLTEMAANMGDDDVVLLYFAGHGVGPLGEEMFYFVPFDGRDVDIRNSGLNTAVLAEALRNMPARRIVLMIDACQSGGAVEALGKIGEIKARVEQRRATIEAKQGNPRVQGVGVHIIAAALPLQYAVQIRTDQSAFAATILDILKASSGPETMHRLIDDLKVRLPDLSQKTVGYRQVPLTSSVGLDFAMSAN